MSEQFTGKGYSHLSCSDQPSPTLYVPAEKFDALVAAVKELISFLIQEADASTTQDADDAFRGWADRLAAALEGIE